MQDGLIEEPSPASIGIASESGTPAHHMLSLAHLPASFQSGDSSAEPAANAASGASQLLDICAAMSTETKLSTVVTNATHIAVERGFAFSSLDAHANEKELVSWLACHRRGDLAVEHALSTLYEARHAVETAARGSTEVRAALDDRSRFPVGSWVAVFDACLHGPFASQAAVDDCVRNDARHFPVAAYAWQIGNEGGDHVDIEVEGIHCRHPSAIGNLTASHLERDSEPHRQRLCMVM